MLPAFKVRLGFPKSRQTLKTVEAGAHQNVYKILRKKLIRQLGISQLVEIIVFDFLLVFCSDFRSRWNGVELYAV